MANIDERYLKRLRDSGLVISDPFPERHVAWPCGVHVGKPCSTKGNSIPEYKTGLDDFDLDAPSVVLYQARGQWHVRAQDYSPTPGPGDFETHWMTAEEAVNDIIDFYLGNPERMAAKAAAKKAVRDRIAAYDEKEKK